MRYVDAAVRSISDRELRRDLTRILRDVQDGETIEVTVDGRPVARLVPIVRRRTGVPREQLEEMLRNAPLDAGFQRDLDDAVGQTIDEL
jgi:prevent-host-death family protein